MRKIQLLSKEKWRFRNLKELEWHYAEIPGCVHTDLYRNHLIPDPFFGRNAADLQWIEREDWEYCCIFEADDDILKYEHINIKFSGLDTYAEVNLNGKFLFSASNMFVPWEKNVKKLLRKGSNQIKVILKSPFLTAWSKHEELPYILPANNDKGERKVSPFTRKAPFMYGWDWGPRLLTSGIWKDVFLEAWNCVKIGDVHFNTISFKEGDAFVTAEVEFYSSGNQNLDIKIITNEEVLSEVNTVVHKGHTLKSFHFRLKDVRLWWPSGYGNPELYNFKIKLTCEDGNYDEKEVITGIRTVELVREKDETGRSFYFRINGKMIFMKGANIIPDEYFVSSITPSHYEMLIDNAVAANMNMLRAWGGAVYEDDYFYELCDRNGIMVWQDFMFACGMYPSDKEYLKSVRNEIGFQVKRLRNHPSLIIWCGNNEILEGFHLWGWKEELGKYANDAYASYRKLFLGLIPYILKRLDNSRPYWASSPSAGPEEKPSLNSGDFHYWDLVKDIRPYTVYSDNIGRFMSEYGFKSYPEYNTIVSFAGESEKDIHSPVFEFHQGWEKGAELVEKNLKWFYKTPKDFKKFLYLSQVLQAEAITYAIESHRRAKPFCMGSLFWQMNDCWPAASWSCVEYSGRRKALHYFLKTAFNNVLLSAEMKGDILQIFLIADIPESKVFNIRLILSDFNGKELFKLEKEVRAENDKAILIHSSHYTDLYNTDFRKTAVLQMNVYDGNNQISSNNYYFSIPAELELEDPQISYSIIKDSSTSIIILNSKKLAKNVFLEFPGNDVSFSDNYFDLFPGLEKKVEFKNTNPDLSPESLMINSLFNSYS